MNPRTAKPDGSCTEEEYKALLHNLRLQENWSKRAAEMRATHPLLAHSDGRARQYGHTFLLHV